jgi:hypothetical protein
MNQLNQNVRYEEVPGKCRHVMSSGKDGGGVKIAGPPFAVRFPHFYFYKANFVRYVQYWEECRPDRLSISAFGLEREAGYEARGEYRYRNGPSRSPVLIFCKGRCRDVSSLPDTAAAATATEAAGVFAIEKTEVRPLMALWHGQRENRMVFEHLPPLSADMSTRWEINALRQVDPEEMAALHAGALAAGVRYANAMAALGQCHGGSL